MEVFIVTYDLCSGSSDYEDLICKIKAYEDHVHISESTWMIASFSNYEDIFADLNENLHADDRLLVMNVSKSHGLRVKKPISSCDDVDELTGWIPGLKRKKI